MNSEVENKIKKAYDLLSSINEEAYKDIFLISNQVLSKNPFNNNFLNNFLRDERPKMRSFYIIVYKFLTYYFKSFLHFSMYLFRFTEYFLSFFQFHFSKNSNELILIDISFVIENIKKSKGFRDLFFPGLEDVLRKKNKYFAYLPFFFSPSYNKKPFELLSALRILKKEKVPMISEYQLLSFYDLLHLLCFIVTYPFHILRFLKTLQADTYEIRLLKHELIDNLDEVTFYSFTRYLLGRRIAKLPYNNIKVISWYENQPMHKNLYKGLKVGVSKIKIYGAQLFIYSKNYLAVLPDENEEKFGVIPDKIIVNGPYYIPEKSKLNYVVGPSLRYSKIFHMSIVKKNQKNILVLLPCVVDDAENILRTLFEAHLSNTNIFVKAHPGVSIEKLKHLIPFNMTIVTEDTYKLFESAKIVISATSGTLIEAASMGIPTISIKNIKRLTSDNPFPEYGKGIIWEEVSDSESLAYQIKKFECNLEKNFEQIDIIADRYKKMFFCEPNEKNINEVFELEP